MKLYFWCILVLTLSACGGDSKPVREKTSNDRKLNSVADAVELNTSALGGDVALDAVQTMIKRSLIEEGDYRDIAIFATDRQGRMRVDIFADGERVFAESYDGQLGHQWRPSDGQTVASERGTTALSHTPHLPNHIFRLRDVVANGHTLDFVETESTDGVEYIVLKLTLSDGFESFLFLDSSTGWVTRSRNRRALHVDVDDDEKVIEARMSDFRRVGDIIHPHRVVEVDLGTDEILTQITLQSLETNVELQAEYFDDLVQIVPNL